MKKRIDTLMAGYHVFRKKYAAGNRSVMKSLSDNGQQPETMIIACCDSRVDPALILQCSPGDLFVVRNMASIVPPYEKDVAHHGTSAALEFGIRFLNIKHLILFGHSQCGGMQALRDRRHEHNSDFVDSWVSLVATDTLKNASVDAYAKRALDQSYDNCFTFPWIREKVESGELTIQRWFFEIETGTIYEHAQKDNSYKKLV